METTTVRMDDPRVPMTTKEKKYQGNFDSRPASGLPSLVIAADWSTDAKKRRMARAEVGQNDMYFIYAPEPVGDVTTFIDRIRSQIEPLKTALVGFDFPIGLPKKYAEEVGITSGETRWQNLVQIASGKDFTESATFRENINLSIQRK